MRALICLLAGLTLAGAGRIAAEELTLPERGAVLKSLRAGHPRLLATADDFQRLRAQCPADQRAGRWLARLKDEATELLSQAPVKYEIPDGKRLLSVSRRAKQRLLLLGLTYQLTSDRRFADRAWRELETVSGFKDWNPKHFLDTAEMTFAVAIGYDWLYDAWTEPQRAQLRAAIVDKGFQPALPIYRTNQWWSRAIHNWNQVCNGGLAVGALAIGENEPALAAEVLHSALHSVPRAMREFRPDGGWGEGPGYWKYATEYNVFLLAALRTALGEDFGLARMPGFATTGDFPIHLTGPSGMTFNFADAGSGWSGAPQLFWLASAFDRPAYAAAQMPHAEAHPSPLDLLWGAAWSTRPAAKQPLPTAERFERVSVVTLRTAWDDPAATFVGFKGGDNRVNHGHLDLGSFVLDALGQRWAIDPGPDDYNMPGYFGRQRWSYFRTNTQSHNTLVIDGANQSPSARAPIVRFAHDDRWTGAVVDLSAAWPQASRVRRGVALLRGGQVVVQDEVAAAKALPVQWQMLTGAAVQLDGQQAILTQGDRRLTATLLAPADSRWEVAEQKLDPPQRPLKDVRKLSAAAVGGMEPLRFVVLLSPGGEAPPATPIVPLDEWPAESK